MLPIVKVVVPRGGINGGGGLAVIYEKARVLAVCGGGGGVVAMDEAEMAVDVMLREKMHLALVDSAEHMFQ